VHLSHYRPDGQISVWEPGFSIPNDENLTYFIVGYAGELQSFAEAVHTGGPVNASIADACADLAIVKMLEPDEAYVKGPQDYPHWQSENYWLQTDPTGGGTS
jgi:hypothetical protein